ncbi:hypothetical protein [Plasticicumulans sp.]|uniref:RipA family octameric membrane protein n=1 Tax=Plasticicumulans sp. TaxID=2307179 RepID=UPI0039319A17
MKYDEERNDLDLTLRDDKDSKILAEIFKVTGDHFRNDINALWHRGQFFLLFNLGLLAFFSSTGFDRHNKWLVSLVSGAGLVTSIAWCMILVTTIKWINVWRMALVDMELRLVNFGPFARGENLKGSKFYERYRPEKFAMALSGAFGVLWLIIFVFNLFDIF